MKDGYLMLGAACDPDRTIVVPDSTDAAGLPYLGLDQIESGTGAILERTNLPDQVEGSSTCFRFHDQHVLYGKLRPYLNKVALPQKAGRCSTEIIPLLPKPNADRSYLGWLLRSDWFVAEAMKTTTGSRMPRADLDRLLSLPVYLPPIEEQRRIAARLDEQMAVLSDAQEAVEERIRALVSLPFAMIRESLKSQTSKLPLRKALTEVKQGVGSRWQDFPVLGATRAGVAPAKDKVGKSPERYKLADPTTVFYNPMRIRLGSIALVDDDDPPGITSPDYVVVKGTAGVLDTRWFYYWFRSPAGEALVDSLSRGAVRERILYNRLAEGTIAAPSFEDQIKCSAQIKGVRSAVVSSMTQLRLIASTRSALLHKAFK